MDCLQSRDDGRCVGGKSEVECFMLTIGVLRGLVVCTRSKDDDGYGTCFVFFA